MKYPILILLFILTLTLSCGQQNQQNPASAAEKLLPPAQEISDPALFQFLNELQTAVENKDKEFIINHLDSAVKNNFGGEGGIEEFKAQWKWSGSAISFWAVMNEIMELGGGAYKGKGRYAMPYVFTYWPEKYDPFQHVAVTAAEVKVRKKPDLKKGKVLGTLDYEIVSYDYEKSLKQSKTGGRQWYYVETLDGRMEGYVYGEYVWSPIGYRVGFEKKEGEWKIAFLLAGD